MAIFLPGVAVGSVSGRVGGTVFSHNRGGAYMRNGVIPKKVTSANAIAQKAACGTVSKFWSSLTDDQRAAWLTYSIDNPRTNRLGQKKTLTGHQAFVGLNSRLVRCGDAVIAIPPMVAPPAPATIGSFSVDTALNTAEIAFTPTPVGAAIRMWVFAAVVDSPAIEYVDNRFSLLTISPLNEATPLDIFADLEAKFGTLQAGQTVHIKIQLYDSATGLVSGFDYTKVLTT